ncbi:hypothetical protein EYF80_035734 [Liparis tanakae]|uniref:Uncharacterized protein n=1 Tax=Liparis tanakae TaxID=230148 RepID=A0A4Z2GML7_9TELE|nr:hypothetical protein EYF80_035734 [Liparis tanakae]
MENAANQPVSQSGDSDCPGERALCTAARKESLLPPGKDISVPLSRHLKAPEPKCNRSGRDVEFTLLKSVMSQQRHVLGMIRSGPPTGSSTLAWQTDVREDGGNVCSRRCAAPPCRRSAMCLLRLPPPLSPLLMTPKAPVDNGEKNDSDISVPATC